MSVSAVPSRRLFFALWPDAEAAEHLSALGHAMATPGSRPLLPQQLHMTLAFLGAVPEDCLPALMDASDQIVADSFSVRLDRLGFWPCGGVLYAGSRAANCLRPEHSSPKDAPQSHSTGFRLFAAVAAAARSVGLSLNDRLVVPHVTLARRVRGIDLPRMAEDMGWHASEFALVESHLHHAGPRYQTLATWPLQDPVDPE